MRAIRAVVALFAIAVVARAGVSGNAVTLSQAQENELTPIDSLPTPAQLDVAFQGQALTELTAIAAADGNDVGVRLRAIYALVNYCSPCTVTDAAHQTLVGLISDNANVLSGSQLLILRAAIETLGPLQIATDVQVLAPLLDHPSRDIRATTANAMSDLCSSTAIQPLRVRYSEETVPQVQLAISQALRLLQAPPCSPP